MRKFIMALAAVALAGALAVPSSAEARRGHGHHGFHHGFRPHFVHRHHFVRPRHHFVHRHHFFHRPYWRPRFAYAAPIAYGWGPHCVIKRKIRWTRWGHPVRVVRRICY